MASRRNRDNAEKFARPLKVWANGVNTEGLLIHRRIVVRVIKLIIKNTPRDTGRTRGEWQTSAYFPKSTLIGRIRPQTAVIEEARSVAKSMGKYARVWFTNNMPHIQVLEHGLFIPRNPGPSKDPRKHRFGRVWVVNGFSVQAPRGILKPVFDEINSAGTVAKSREYELGD